MFARERPQFNSGARQKKGKGVVMSFKRLVTKFYNAIAKEAKIVADAIAKIGSEFLDAASWPIKRTDCEHRVGNLCNHVDNKMKEDYIMVPCKKDACPI
jgi:hypothetical protein